MSVTNDLQQSILDAMQLVSDKAASNTGATLTVKCTVVEIVDAGLGLYKLQYGENFFNAYSYLNTTFQEGDLVYVVVPDGDFSQEKIIVGASAPRASMIIPDNESETYVISPDNILNDNLSVDIRSWVNEEIDINESVTKIGVEKLDTLFKRYLDGGKRDFVFSTMLKTEIDKDHQMKGNYGLILTLPFLEKSIDGNGELVHTSRDFVMDVNTIPGNPYGYENFSKVNLYFSIKEGLEYDISIDRITKPKITAFVKDFGYTVPPKKIEYEPEFKDIHFKDISISMMDILTEEETQGYYLTIVSDTGNYFTSGKYNRNKVLSPVLKIKGATSKVNKWECYWFVEDSSIGIDSDGYFAIGGLGWKCLNQKENVVKDAEGHQTFQYNTSNYTYTVKSTDVQSTLRYKCVLVQKEIVVSGFIEITNLDSEIDIQLVSSTGSSSFVEDVGYVALTARIYYPGATTNSEDTTVILDTTWQRFDKDNNYLDNDFYEFRKYNEIAIINEKQYLETEIIYPCTKLDEINTINCTFYSKETTNVAKEGEEPEYVLTTKNLGTKSITVNTASGLVYGLSIQGGDVVYKYDADGDSPMEGNYDGPLSSKITTIDPITYKIFKADGTELTDVEYRYCSYEWLFPEKSLMKLKGYGAAELKELLQEDGYYHITGYGISSLNYTIAATYNKKKNNNSILLRVLFDGVEIVDSVTPKFLKDGEGGTNGSKYAAILKYKDYGYGDRDGYGRRVKLQAAYAAAATAPNTPGWKIYDLTDKTVVGPDGQPITDERGRVIRIRDEKLIDFNDPELKVEVYKDGKKVNDEKTYSISWSMFDSSVVNPCFSVSKGILKNKIRKIKIEKEKPIDTDIDDNIEPLNTPVEDEVHDDPLSGLVDEPTEEIEYEDLIVDLDDETREGQGYTETIVNWDNPKTVYCNIVQAKITIKENSETGSQEVLYAYYPIEITWIKNLQDSDIIVPNLDGGFEEVVYASDGTNPQYDNSNYFTCIDSLYNNESKNYYKYSWKVWDPAAEDQGEEAEKEAKEKSHLKITRLYGDKVEQNNEENENTDEEGEEEEEEEEVPVNGAAIKPTTRFDNGDSKNFVWVSLTLNDEQRAAITNNIAEVQEKIDDCKNKLSFYKNNQKFLSDFVTKFDYNTLVADLDKSKRLLELRDKAIDATNQMKDKLEIFNTYCKDKKIYEKFSRYEDDYLRYYEDVTDAYESLYLLGFSEDLDSIQNLSYNVLELDTKKIKSLFNAGISSAVAGYAEDYNLALDNYNLYYISLKAATEGVYDLKEEYDNYENIVETIVGLPEDDDLENLVKIHDSNNPPQEFVNLQRELDAIVSHITKAGDGVTNYNYFIENILKPINKLLVIYKDADYQDSYYRNVDSKFKFQLAEAEDTLNTFKVMQLPQNMNEIVHVKPIVMLFNRYEMANLNNWDGNKLYIDEKNNEYLLAPQVGAGTKTSTGQFTGVVMGVKQFQKNNKGQRIGLFGYSEGLQSFFINAQDGSAIMGKAGKGQILIDPSADQEARIYSGNFYKKMDQDGKPASYNKSNEAGEGMLINLSLPEIRFGSGDFSVNKEGYIRAAGGGWIGGWKITDNEIYSDIKPNEGRITINSGTKMYFGYYCNITDENAEKIIDTIIIYCNTENTMSPTLAYVKYQNEIYEVKERKDSRHITIKLDESGNKELTLTTAVPLNDLHKYIEDKVVIDKFSKNDDTIELQCYNCKIIKENDQTVDFTIKIYINEMDYTIDYIETSRYINEEWNKESKRVIFPIKFYTSYQEDIGNKTYAIVEAILQEKQIILDETGNEQILDEITIKLEFDHNNDLGDIRSFCSTHKSIGTNPDLNTKASYGKIYSHKHETLKTANTGFYLSSDGLSIGSKVRITEDGVAYFGAGAVNDNSKKHWTINGDPAANESYISYNTEKLSIQDFDTDDPKIGGKKNQVYIGTNGIRLGNQFAVDSGGTVVANRIFAEDEGRIAGWTIKKKLLSSGDMKISSSGFISGNCDGPEDDSGWMIMADGKAYFNEIYARESGVIGGWTINKDSLEKLKQEIQEEIEEDQNQSGTNPNPKRTLMKASANEEEQEGVILDGKNGQIICKSKAAGTIVLNETGLYLEDNSGTKAGNEKFKLNKDGLSFSSGGLSITPGESGGIGLDENSTTIKTSDGDTLLKQYIQNLVVDTVKSNLMDSTFINCKGIDIDKHRLKFGTGGSVTWEATPASK